MKYVISMLAVLSLNSFAANNGIVRTIDCKNSNSEGGETLQLTILNPGMPGIEGKGVASATQGWLGGTHSSGSVSVDIITAADGGLMTLVNQEKGFAVTFHQSNGKTQISGKFKDARQEGLSGQLAGSFTCRESN